MSRIGKLPILVPDGVTVNVDGQTVNVTGPKGTLTMTVHRRVSLHLTERQLTVSVVDAEAQSDRALWGLTRMLVANMITGVTAGYQKQLEINGVGFKAQVSGQNLILNLGFSHPVNFPIPAGITITVEKNVATIGGIDKQLVGETAATIRRLKKPEPYKGKGIKYLDEVIRRKAGKVVKAAGAK
ncbi:MAG: 50S ribosomal protein L6 [Patescibacteria group bacterium]|mgnify:CR=1 FL=1